jgi:nucleoside-diphosphate-sugar epimerase
MLVALTGASGFIGSYTARALVARDHKVRALVRRTSRRDHIEDVVKEFMEGDYTDAQVQRRLVDGVEAVIHNAIDWDKQPDSPEHENFHRNVLASLRLLEQARLAGVRQFIFVSSVAAYHEILADRPLDENHPTWPRNTYGACKAAVESHLKAYHFGYQMNTSAWRPAAVYGIDPNLKRSQWYDLILAARNSQHIRNDKGGKITHVQDCADALALAVGDESTAGQFYNLVDCYMYWQVAAELAKQISGSSAVIEDCKGKGPRNQFDTRKAIAFFERHGNTTALRRGTEGVRDYVGAILQQMK